MSNYKAGDKFEIEIDSDFVDWNGNKLYRIKGFNSLVFDENGLNKLQKAKLYDVEDLAKIESESFDRGYKWGIEVTEKAYQAQAEKEKPKTVKASELAVDTKVLCWDEGISNKCSRHFAMLHNGILYAYNDGRTFKDRVPMCHWEFMTLEDGTPVLPE